MKILYFLFPRIFLEVENCSHEILIFSSFKNRFRKKQHHHYHIVSIYYISELRQKKKFLSLI